MYSGLEFVNGYSAMNPTGMEELLPFRAHGYVQPQDGKRLLRAETGPHRLLQLLAVNGLVVADHFAACRPDLLANGPASVVALVLLLAVGRRLRHRSAADAEEHGPRRPAPPQRAFVGGVA